jgi:hypothetical protein
MQRKLLGAGGAAAEHTGYLSTKTHGPAWLQLRRCSRCVALRCVGLLDKRTGRFIGTPGRRERHRRLVLCRCGSGCAGEEMARQWAHDPSQFFVLFVFLLFSSSFLFLSFLFFSLFSQAPSAVAHPALLHGLACAPTRSVSQPHRLSLAPTREDEFFVIAHGLQSIMDRHVVRGVWMQIVVIGQRVRHGRGS